MKFNKIVIKAGGGSRNFSKELTRFSEILNVPVVLAPGSLGVLSDEHKKVIDNNAGLALAKLAGQLWDGFEVPARKLALDAGGTIHSLSGGPLAEMKAAGEGLEKDWIKSANDRGLDGAMLVKTAKDLISKYDK